MQITFKTRLVLATLFGLAAAASAWHTPDDSAELTPAIQPSQEPEHLGGLVEPIEIPGWNRSPADRELALKLAKFGLDDPFSHDANAHFHAHGDKVCASGCAASRHPTEELTKDEFTKLMESLVTSPRLDSNNLAFETLLYYGRQTSDMLLRYGSCGVSSETLQVLNDELQRTHVQVEIRVVDEAGEVRSWLPTTRVPLDRRHVFEMETERLQPLVTSGTVKRVGLDHLWTRL